MSISFRQSKPTEIHSPLRGLHFFGDWLGRGKGIGLASTFRHRKLPTSGCTGCPESSLASKCRIISNNCCLTRTSFKTQVHEPRQCSPMLTQRSTKGSQFSLNPKKRCLESRKPADGWEKSLFPIVLSTAVADWTS